MANIDVSIIVCTYNSDFKKIKRTVLSAIKQKGVSTEIMLSDDCSTTKDYTKTAEFIKKYNYNNFYIIENKTNLGISRNVKQAVEKAQGKYVFLCGPGDLIFEENTLKKFYDFCEKMEAKICFGDYFSYCYEDGKVRIINEKKKPAKPSVYDKNYNYYKTIFCFGANITGVSFFRRRKELIKYLNFVSEYSKNVEDNTTMVYALANNEKVYYLKEPIVWYEYGDGVSTTGDSKWDKKINNDLSRVFEAVIKDYPRDRIIKAGYIYRKRKYGKLTIPYLIIHHPISSFRVIKSFFIKNNRKKCGKSFEKELEKLIKEA